MDNILQNWGLSGMVATPIDTIHESAWDVGGIYVLKRYSDIGELNLNVQLTEFLAEENIPAPKYVPATDGQIAQLDVYCLMTKMPGSHVDFYENPELAYEMGKELARLHMALARLESKISCTDSDFLANWRHSIQTSIKSEISDAVIEHIDELFTRLYPKLPRQLIHRDVHSLNLLFDGGKLSAWLDFDIGQRNARIFDIAYLLSGLILENTDDPAKVDMWHSLYRDIIKGYSHTSPLTADEYEALPVMIIMIELLFAYFWASQKNIKQRDAALNLAKWLCNEFNI